MVNFFLLFYGFFIISGIWSYLKIRKTKHVQELYKVFQLIIFLPFLDMISTILFTSKLGIEYEGNEFLRVLFYKIGDFCFPVMYVIAVIIWMSFVATVFYAFRFTFKGYNFSKKSVYFYYLLGIVTGIYIAVVIRNLSAFMSVI